MKPKEEYLIGVQFPASRSPRDFNMVLIAMQKHAEDYHSQFSQPSDVIDVNYLLTNALRHLDNEQLKSLANSINARVQPSDVSDEDIDKYAWEATKHLTHTTSLKQVFINGAKAMRDGQIKPTIEGEHINK